MKNIRYRTLYRTWCPINKKQIQDIFQDRVSCNKGAITVDDESGHESGQGVPIGFTV